MLLIHSFLNVSVAKVKDIFWELVFISKCFWSTHHFQPLWIFPSATAELSSSLWPEQWKKRISASVISTQITHIKSCKWNASPAVEETYQRLMVRWGEMKTDRKAWRLYREKKESVSVPRYSLFILTEVLPPNTLRAELFLRTGPYEAGAWDRDASPTTMSCFGLWSGLMGCWPALPHHFPPTQFIPHP